MSEDLNKISESVAIIKNDLEYIQRAIGDIKCNLDSLDEKYASQSDMTIIKKIVFGMVGLILVSFFGLVVNVAFVY